MQLEEAGLVFVGQEELQDGQDRTGGTLGRTGQDRRNSGTDRRTSRTGSGRPLLSRCVSLSNVHMSQAWRCCHRIILVLRICAEK